MRSATFAKTVAYALTENIPLSASACQVFMEKTVEVWYLNLPVWLCMRHRRHLTPFAKQRPYPSCGPPTDSMNYWKCVSNFLFNLIRKLIMALLTGQSWHVLKSWNARVGAQNQDFGAVSQTDLIRSLDPSVVQARSNLVFCLFEFLLLFHVKFHLWT